MAELLADFRFVLRSLGRRPVLAAAVLATFGLGIGANSAVFSVVDAVLLRALPYRDPGRLAVVWDANAGQGVERSRTAPARFAALGEAAQAFEEVAAVATAKLPLVAGEEPLEVQVARVTPNFFSLLGVAMISGRGFAVDDGRPGAGGVAVVGERLWRGRFGGDRALVGEVLTLDGEPYQVIGVAPSGLVPFDDAEVWVPLTLDSWQSRVARFLTVVGRLPAGNSPAQAQRHLDVVAERLAQGFPDTDAGWGLRLVPLREEVVGGVEAGLLVLWGAVACVLLVACINVAAVLLARGIARRPEIAVRLALGAGRGRVLRLLLAESLLLAAAGGALGLALAAWGARVLVQWAPVAVPQGGEIGIDGRVLAFTLVAVCLSGAASGLLPAALAARLDLAATLKQGGERSGGGRRAQRWFHGLVVAEIALSLVLLAGGGLLGKSFARLVRVDLGLRPEGVLTFRLAPPRYRYPRSGDWARVYGEVLAELRRIPGVRAAGAVSQLPMGGASSEFRFFIEGDPRRTAAELPTAEYRVVSPGYFESLGIAVLEGEALGDGAEARGAVLVNRALARRFWPGASPVGRRLSVDGPEGPWLTVLGVAADVRHHGPGEDALPELYRSYAGDPWPGMTFTVRAAGDPWDLAPQVRAAVRRVDPALPLAEMRTLDEVVADALARPRFTAVLLGVFAALALLLAAVGLYGTMACSVARRTREVGVRMSLGARRRDVAAAVLGRALRLAAAGAALGLGASFFLSRFLGHLLFEVRAADPLVLGGVTLLAVAVSVGAAAVPALRASRVEPGVALRTAHPER